MKKKKEKKKALDMQLLSNWTVMQDAQPYIKSFGPSVDQNKSKPLTTEAYDS